MNYTTTSTYNDVKRWKKLSFQTTLPNQKITTSTKSSFPVIDVSNKAKVKIILPKPKKKKAQQAYLLKCIKQISQNEDILLQSYYNTSELDSIYNRTFNYLLHSFIKQINSKNK